MSTASNPNSSANPQTTGSSKGRTGLFIGLAVVVLLAIVAFIAGPKVYAHYKNANAASGPELLGTNERSSVDAEAPLNLDGTWKTTTDGYVGYRVDEILRGEPVTVTGRSSTHEGTFTIEGTKLTALDISVNVADIKTDAERRDKFFATKLIDSAKNPKITFTATEPVDITDIATKGQSTVEVPGEISINGVTSPVTAKITADASENQIFAEGTIPVVWKDLGLTAPQIEGFVSVEDHGDLEFSVKATKS